jgi:ABC-type multidrug transport system fused ATPase/permease subunit
MKDKITEKSRLVTRILNALLLSIVVLSFVTEFEKGVTPIVNIVFYVLVLRYCMSNLLNPISIINRLSSALPGARRVQQVSAAFEKMTDEEPIPS